MSSNLSPDQVHNDIQTLGKYPIIIRVRVRDRDRFMVRVRVRVQLPTEQTHELIMIIN